MNPKEFMNIEELCSYLHIGRTTAYKLIRAKTIPAKKIASKWVILKRHVDDYLSDQ